MFLSRAALRSLFSSPRALPHHATSAMAFTHDDAAVNQRRDMVTTSLRAFEDERMRAIDHIAQKENQAQTQHPQDSSGPVDEFKSEQKVETGGDCNPAKDDGLSPSRDRGRGPTISWMSPTGGTSWGYDHQRPKLPYNFGPNVGHDDEFEPDYAR